MPQDDSPAALEGFVRGRGRSLAGRAAMPPPKRPAHPLPPPAGDPVLAWPGTPDPHPPYSDGPLTEDEAAELAACEAAIRDQQIHFVWRVGRALHVISQGRLYRQTHARFEDYLAEKWDGISQQRAYQLIAAWPVAEGLAAAGADMDHVNEGQLRPLTPITRRHGPAAAIMVYTTVTETAAEIDGAKVTAKVITAVTGALPPGSPDKSLVAEQARRALTSPDVPLPAERPWAITRENALKALRQLTAAGAGPGERRAALAEMRRLLDEIEATLSAEPADGSDD